MYKNLTPLIILFVIMLISGSRIKAQCCDSQPIKDVINEALDFSAKQSLLMAASLRDRDSLLPKTADRFGNLETCRSRWWTSGFFPGTLWYLYENSGNEEFKKLAHEFSLRVEDQQYTTDNHDVGFMIYCSFGNGYRLTKNEDYKKVIHTASNSLITRFNEKTRAIRSWNSSGKDRLWQYAVIIDNMMNLEMLLWAAKEFNEPKFYDISVTHADVTLVNHYRPDYSCYHVVSYDTLTGQPQYKHTAQGYSHESSWARGQAWGLYGYVLMYRFTKNEAYLNHAKNIAKFLLSHPNLPEDKIPYWDFNAPNIPDTYRDASAGAIICSALIELSQYVDSELSDEYLSIAETQIRALSSSKYRNALGNNANFILKHSVGHLPNNTEVDVPLSYADYYFVEALLRYKKLKNL